MQFEVETNGRVRRANVRRTDNTFIVDIDGRAWTVDAARVDAESLSLLVEGEWPSPDPGGERQGALTADNREDGRTRSFEVTVIPETSSGRVSVAVGAMSVSVVLNGRRRWGRKGDGGHTGAGPQRIVAPMPGKVVRVLVKQGESVRARQPVVVIEAMKMENELRAGRDGIVAEIHVREGQSVEAGGLLTVIAAHAHEG